MKKVSLSILSIFTVLFFISCGSTPAPEEAAPEAPVVQESAAEETEPAVEDTEESTDGLDEDAYAALIAQIEDARNAAVQAGAEESAPDQLKAVDDLYASLKDSGLEDNANLLISKYKLLENYSKAKAAKDEVDDNGFAFYAQKNYDEGVLNLDKVESAFNNPGEMDSSIGYAAENAYSSFNTVLAVAYKRLAKAEREEAYAAKKNADSVKAGVSQKERYKAAADDFQSGDSLYSMQSPKKALEKYTSAKTQFTDLYNDVSEKRAAAQAAIEEAKKRVAESEKYAADADAKAPITEQVDGIEDEDAVLLEDDDYEDPADAEADISETIDDGYEENVDVAGLEAEDSEETDEVVEPEEDDSDEEEADVEDDSDDASDESESGEPVDEEEVLEEEPVEEEM